MESKTEREIKQQERKIETENQKVLALDFTVTTTELLGAI